MNELKLKARNAWFAALAMTAIAAIAAILAFAAVMTVSAQSDTPDWRLPVTGLTAVAGDDPGEMIISWDAHTQTTKTFLNYRVAWTPQGERFKSADRTNWNVYTTSNQHTVTGLDAGATYQVKVRTRYEGKQGSRWTDVVTGQSAVTTNTPATGQPTIAGTVETGETLTAATSSISDDNGLANAAFAYQWIHTATDSEAYIPAATGSSYLLSSDDLGHSIKVRVTFTDDDGYTERLTSSATALVVMPANVAATGQPTITGTAEVGETLTAASSAISDSNGITNAVFSHQWVRSANGSDNDITDATGSTYVVTNADVDTAIKVRVSFTDDDAYSETLTSNATTSVPVPAPVIVPPEEPQIAEASHDVLVSNTAQTVSSSGSSHFQAQSFTTGANAGGYTVTEIQIHLRTINANQTTNVKIRDNNSSSQPGNLVATLSNPATLTAGALNTFTAPANTTLDASATYWLSVSEGELSKLTYGATDGTGETGATGWSIGDTHLWRAAEGTTAWSSTTNVLVIAIHGTLSTSTTSDDASLTDLELEDNNSSGITLTPTFASATTTYTAQVVNSVDEITITPTVNDSTASYEIQNNAGTALTDADTNTTGFQVALSEGANIIKVEVTAENASTETYTVTVTRAATLTPTTHVLVSNTGKATDPNYNVIVGSSSGNKISQAQRFTTGDNEDGYTLSSVRIHIKNFAGSDAVRVSIYEADSSGLPDNSIYPLMNPGSIANNSFNTFTAPANATLAKETKYFVVAEAASGSFTVSYTSSNAEDSGKANGWNINNKRHDRESDSSVWDESLVGNSNLRMSVSGTIIPSDDATLSSLAIQGATNGETVDLSPAFHVNTFAYTAFVANSIDAVTLTATKNENDAAVAITGDDASTPDTADLDLDVGANTLTVTVTAEDTTTTLTYTITVTRNEARPDPTEVLADWSLTPSGLGVGDEFRLIFLSSTKRNASSSSIGTYNTFIQDLVANGHADIQDQSDGFTVVGCTAAVDARDNTSTRHNSADRGVPIYWLGGNKVADEYQDFYDETWDNEANPKNELGNNGLNISQVANQPWTGCKHNGTEAFPSSGFVSAALGQGFVTLGAPNSTLTTESPIGSNITLTSSSNRPMYGLSQVFQVVAPPMLSDLAIEGATDGQTIILTPAFDADTNTYTASVANRIYAVQLTATKKSTDATVVITSDDDTSTANRANLDLSVGTNTLTVTVTAENATTQTYTVTVTRAAEPPAPIDCPADTDWCTTMGVGYTTSTTVGIKIEFQGYRSNTSYGDLRTGTFSHTGTSYAVTQLYVHKNTIVTTNAVTSNSLNLVSNPPLPDGAALQLGNRIFTVDADSAGNVRGLEQWVILSDPLNWTEGQHVTTSLRFAGAYEDATLSSLAIQGATNRERITLSPAFDRNTITYTAVVPNRIDAVTLTTAANNSNATVAITGDDDANSPDTADLDLDVGDTTITVTVTAEDTVTTETYTITVTRLADHITLVSNTGQTTSTATGLLVGTSMGNKYSQAQQFTTGDNEDGYTLSTVQIYIREFAGSDAAKISIYEANSSGNPNSSLYQLTNPSQIANNRLNTFTAPANVTLAKETKYLVVAEATSGSFEIGYTSSNAEDSGKANGWSINNRRHTRDSDSGSWSLSPVGSTNIRISLSGAINTNIEVPFDWSLIPTGRGPGDRFRLIFLSSTKRDGSSTTLADYNTFIQNRVAAGHPDILVYSANFSAVGCTEDTDARDNTGTTYTSTDKGVRIHWLGGAKVANQYEDFYDGNWDNEANPKDESGANGPNTNQSSDFPITGCDHDGTEDVDSGDSFALGTSPIRVGVLDASGIGFGPLSGSNSVSSSSNRPMYGLSAVFIVAEISDDATLSGLAIEGTTGAETITLSPAFDVDTLTYTAEVAHSIDAVTLTATKNDSNATVAITSDSNAGTPDTADLDLSVGANTLTVTVTAEDTVTTETYTVTVTRAQDPTEPATVLPTWSLIPSELSNTGDQFRLLFLSSLRRNGSSSDIADYNTFVQERAAAGHTDIQAYSNRFTAVGCTTAVDARDNTGTTYTSTDKGVPIYWLNGNKVADEYQDFYDGDWDEEAAGKNELGNAAYDTSQLSNRPLTGCDDDGTEAFVSSQSRALGNGGDVTVARPNSSGTGDGPLSSGQKIDETYTRPMYALSQVFTVTEPADCPTDTTWCTTMGVRNTTTTTSLAKYEFSGYNITDRLGTLSSTTFSHGSTDYTINRLEQTTFTTLPANTISLRNFYLKAEPALPAGTILTLGDRSFTVGDESDNPTMGQEEWDTIDNPLNWTNRQEVTVSLKIPPDATLSNIAIEGTADGQTVVLRPAFDEDTLTYTARVGNGIDEVTLTATKNNSNATVVIANDDETRTPDTADLDLDVGSNTLAVTVTAMDTTTTSTLTYTITVTRTESGSAMLVPGDWSLIPTGLSVGDSFRLLFLSSTRHDASSASIDTYNTFVQGRAANGHTDIQAYSDGFTVVGCTAAVDARDNTGTTFTSSNKGVPLYWLNGNKVADDYQDFYDGSWDDEANDKNQSGNNGPDTSDNEYYPLTGCDHNGTENFISSQSHALASSAGVTVARPNSSDTGHGPLSSGFQLTATNSRPMYGLSAVFTVTDLSDATLSSLDLVGTTGGESITLSPAFRNNTFTYTTSVANGIDAVTLTATKNESTATVAITGDADTSTPNEAELHLDVGDNTLTVTVTADDTITTETYTVTVTRDAPQVEAQVYVTWSLKPSGFSIGDQFRLLFLSSTKRNATSSDIADYNTFIQDLAAAGHTDIQTHSSGFTAVGCTRNVDARDNTNTLYTSSDKGVPIYWLRGPKIADDYEDFYDGAWDNESNSHDRDESGSNTTDTSDSGNGSWTGCQDDGTEASFNGSSRALGRTYSRIGDPGVPHSGINPIDGGFDSTATLLRPMYGLSELFEVVPTSVPSTPTGTTATAFGGMEVTLSWTAPADDGGLDIAGYRIEVSENSGTSWTDLVTDTGAANATYSHSGLSTGTTRHYRVSAINADGTGLPSVVAYTTTAVSEVLVGNTGQTGNPDVTEAIGDQDKTHSQGFETGPHPRGYNLTSVALYVADADLSASETFTVYVYTSDTAGEPDELEYTMESPASYTPNAVNVFTAPAGAALTSDTTYHVVFQGTGDSAMDLILGMTTSHAEDHSSKPAWGIEDGRRFQDSTTTDGTNFQIRVNGTPIPTIVPSNWSLQPTGLTSGDQFRLLFLSSTKRNATSSDIETYNTFVQDLAEAGHDDIQAYSDGFRAVGCTRTVDARDNTSTLYTSFDQGVPTYWLSGPKIADDYEDFYDGAWDNESNSHDRDESGSNTTDTSDSGNGSWTGCQDDGTEASFNGSSRALGRTYSRIGDPGVPHSGINPIDGGFDSTATLLRPMYGLSELLEVPPNATLNDLTIVTVADSQPVVLSPDFENDTFTYTAAVANETDRVTLTATKKDSLATLVITGDDDINTPDTADLDLSVGDTTLTVTVTAADATTETYTVSVIRAMAPASLIEVPPTWDLIHTGLGGGAQFRLIFLSSTARDATSINIDTYNGFIQDLAAAGHTAIRAYSAGFRVVACTVAVDAHDNTGTTGTGVPIYWLSGNKVADTYADFYDGNWDDEANDKNESGTDGPDTSQLPNRPYTGCDHDGTELFIGSASQALGESSVVVGGPNATNVGPLRTTTYSPSSESRPFYGLSQIFQVTPISPSAPTNLTATAPGATQINLEWHTPTNNGGAAISGYKIQHSPNGTSDWTNLDSYTGNADTTYSDTGLSPATMRYYRVFAINSIGTSDASNIANATTTVVPLDRVTDVSITPDNGALSIRWTAVSDATGYKVQWKSGNQNYNTSDRQALTSPRSTTYYLITGLNNGTLYAVRVIATKPGRNDGPPSVERTGTPSDILPTVTFGPGSFTASENGATARVTVEISVPADVTIPFRVQHRNGATSADYSGVPRRLIFEDGNTIRSFTVTAVDDSDNDDDEKIRIDFKDLPAGFQAGARSSITVNLKDNDGGNSLPLFDPANELRDLVENTAPNQNVGLPITATDADGDSLTYTFDGPDMDRFTFVPSTAQIQTKSGQIYDYETHELFVVRVTADDGNGGTKTATVVVRVRDMAEPPEAPTSLTRVQAYPTSMALSWTPPDNTGRPAITGYDLQYKKSNETTWTAGHQGITETSDSITGLDPSTSYNVQVRANNDEGNGPWSSTLSRSTPSTSPGISITKTNLTVTEGDQTGRIYRIVLGSQPTADVHVYIYGYDETTVAPHSRSKTFNTGNWNAPREVTLRTIEDADTTDETVTITHQVVSDDADYNGITVASLTVTVVDNDTPQVTGVSIQPGYEQLTVNWSAAPHATGYKLQWRRPGQSYDTHTRLITITSSSTTTYTIPDLTNLTPYQVRVAATRTGQNDGPWSEEVTGTPTATP